MGIWHVAQCRIQFCVKLSHTKLFFLDREFIAVEILLKLNAKESEMKENAKIAQALLYCGLQKASVCHKI